MGVQPTGVLSPDDLNDTDGRVLNVLQDGRVTPQYVADQLGVSRTYASERLKRLVEHGHVARLASGLYELADDPRDEGGGVSHTPAEAQVEKLEHRMEELRAERDTLQAKIDELESRDGGSDNSEMRRALDDIEAAAERGDGDALREALERAREVLDDVR